MTELARREPEQVRLAGDLDAWKAGSVRAAFASVTAGRVVAIDLSGVTFMDSAGLGALIGGIRRVRDRGGEAVMWGARRSVAKLLTTTGVDRLAHHFGTFGEATDWAEGVARSRPGD